MASTDGGENRGAKRGAFFGLEQLDFPRVDIRLNLSPERRTRTTAAETNLGHGHIHFVED